MDVVTQDWPFEVRLVPLDEMFADGRYQRPPQEQFIAKLTNSWDDSLVGVLDGSERQEANGKPALYAIMDGLQRYEGMKKVGKTAAYVAVYTGMSLAEEAMFFYRKNRDRRTVHPFYSFRAKMVAGDDTCKNINAIVESQGYKLGSTASGDDMIPSIRACEEAYSYSSPARKESLTAALNMMRRAWYGRKGGKNGELIRGLGRFFQNFGHDDIDLQWLEDKLIAENPVGVSARAREAYHAGSYMSNPVAEEILKLYNKGKRSGKLNRNYLTKTR